MPKKIYSPLDIENKLWEFMDREEEERYYNEILERMIRNPRFYLDNLEDLYLFRVSFRYYYPERDYYEGMKGTEDAFKTKHL